MKPESKSGSKKAVSKVDVTPQTQKKPASKATGSSKKLQKLQLALKQAVTEANLLADDADINALTNLLLNQSIRQNELSGEKQHQVQRYLQELNIARAMNMQLADDMTSAVDTVETTVKRLMGARQCLLLAYDEITGVYTCMNDEKEMNAQPREISCISDRFLQEWLNSENVIHAHLMFHDALVGLVAIADKSDGQAFVSDDQDYLDLMAPYIGTKLMALKRLRKTLVQPYFQGVINEAATKLISAVDQESILISMLDLYRTRLGFDVCQYVELNPESGRGSVMYENVFGNLSSYQHAGLEGKRQVVKEFAGIVSLLASVAREDDFLCLTGGTLGAHSLSDMFKVDDIHSAMIIPVFDLQEGTIKGTLNCFRTSDAPISKDVRVVTREMILLMAKALGRASVLEKALALATIDELTGLMNRRGMYERFEAEIERARRHPSHIAVALIDLDHFKSFNDTHGHLMGDLLLQNLGSLLNEHVRKSDVVCRFGGEEFVIMLPDTDIDAAEELLERLRRAVEAMVIENEAGDKLSVTMSVGVAEVDLSKPKKGEKPAMAKVLISRALAVADERLYHVKSSGRNQVCSHIS